MSCRQHARSRSRGLHCHTTIAFPRRICSATFWHVALLLAYLPAGLSSRDVLSANQADLAQLPLSSHTCSIGQVVQNNYCTFSNLVLWQNQLFYVASGKCTTHACLDIWTLFMSQSQRLHADPDSVKLPDLLLNWTPGELVRYTAALWQDVLMPTQCQLQTADRLAGAWHQCGESRCSGTLLGDCRQALHVRCAPVALGSGVSLPQLSASEQAYTQLLQQERSLQAPHLVKQQPVCISLHEFIVCAPRLRPQRPA